MDKNEKKPRITTTEAAGSVAIGVGILAAVDYFLGEVWAFLFITLGCFATFYGSKLTATGIMQLVNSQSNESIKTKMEDWWYKTNTSPHDPDRMVNPTPEQIREYIKIRSEMEEAERLKAEADSGSGKDKDSALG